MSFRSILVTQQCKCSYQAEYLIVRQVDRTVKIHLSEIDAIVFETMSTMVSGYLLSELARHKKLVVFCDDKHLPCGSLLPLYGAHNMRAKCDEQLAWSRPAKKQLWKKIVKQKIMLQADVLEAFGYSQSSQLRTWAADVASDDSTNREACAAALYFPTLFGKSFTRSQNSTINASLNFSYQLLLAFVAREIASRGYLTQMGIHHCSQYNHFNLASDFMEPFRPYFDYFVVLNQGRPFDSTYKADILKLFNETVVYAGGEYRISSVITKYVEDCFRVLDRSMDVGDLEIYSSKYG